MAKERYVSGPGLLLKADERVCPRCKGYGSIQIHSGASGVVRCPFCNGGCKVPKVGKATDSAEHRARLHKALDKVMDARRAKDALYTPSHSNPVPTGWLKLSNEAMALAGRAQSYMGSLDKYREDNKPGFSALRKINEAQRAGNEAKLRMAFEELRTWLAKQGHRALDAEFTSGDHVICTPVKGAGIGTTSCTVERINKHGQIEVKEPSGAVHSWHPAHVHKA